MFEKKNTIEKKSRKHAKLCDEKTEEILNSILVPLTAQVTLSINKKIDFIWDGRMEREGGGCGRWRGLGGGGGGG